MIVWMSRSRLFSTMLWLADGLFSAAWVLAAVNLRSPYFLQMRDWVFRLWLTGGCLALMWMFRQRRTLFTRFRPVQLVACAAVAGAVLAGHGRWRHESHRRMVAAIPLEHMPKVGRHLIIGWLGFEPTRNLAIRNAIAGVFLTNRDFPEGTGVTEIRRTVNALQAARRDAGLPQLWIATDQEGGPVAKLSPPLPQQPALGSLLRDLDGPGLAGQPERAAEIVRRVTAYADTQARALAEAGINMDFSPVVDLRPTGPPSLLDRNSRIADRALAADPATVCLAGETYVRTLERHGITAVLKHFPGLGRVPADTHHFAAKLDATTADLSETDWLPFREVSRRTGAGIMLGHVRVTTLDPDHPASCSAAVMRDLLRHQWGLTGLLVTDDFSMTPIFHAPGGIVRAAETSMAAGVDLILLSYDAAAVYDLLAALDCGG